MPLLRLTSLLLALATSPIRAAIGDRCSAFWHDTGCICLDKSVCENRWGGVSIEGWAPEWPCPHDPANVWGCQVSPCRQSGAGTSCQWRDRCVLPVPGEPAVCPGGRDFICCDLAFD